MSIRSNTSSGDSEAIYSMEIHRLYSRELARSVGKPPAVTVVEVRSRPGTAQVGIFTGTGKGLTLCISGTAIRQVVEALNAIAAKGGA